MSRFWMTPDDAVDLVLNAFDRMKGGETFIPKCPSFWVWDLARAIGGRVELLGIRGSEKLHEALIGPGESRNAVEVDDMYILNSDQGTPLRRDFEYTSDNNPQFLTVTGLKERLNELTI
jgi:UDP-N-acetylglucosamine 4,6-dehydratase